MLKIIQENIFNVKVDAIVNPANTSLLKGSGLCGLIHKRAGVKLEDQCKLLGKQDVGQALITPSFGLSNCEYVIHACGPRWNNGNHNEEENLALVHQNILSLAKKHHLKSLAIPAISSGIYRFPQYLAASIAIDTILANLTNKLSVYIVVNEQDKFTTYSKVAALIAKAKT